MSAVKVLKIIGKNILAFLAGAVIGLVLALVVVVPIAFKKSLTGQEPGAVIAGAIALAPVFMIIYGFLGSAIGGFSGLIIYNATKFILKRRKKQKHG